MLKNIFHHVPTTKTVLVEKNISHSSRSAYLRVLGSIMFPQELVTRPCDAPGEYSTRRPTYHIRLL